MDKWLAKFLDDSLEDRTDIPDTLPNSVSMSVLSVPVSGIPAKKIFSPTVDSPASPLPAHCFVTYSDTQGRLCGGWDERNACTVKQCHGVGADCQIRLSDGHTIPLRAVRAVGQLNTEGRLIAVWTVREHGYDGNGPFKG